MKKIVSVLLILTLVVSLCYVNVSAAPSQYGVDLSVPSTACPGDTIAIRMTHWVIADQDYSDSEVTMSTTTTVALDESIFDISTITLTAVSGIDVDADDLYFFNWDEDYHEVCPEFWVTPAIASGEKYEVIYDVNVKIKDTVAVGTIINLKSAYGVFMGLFGKVLFEFNVEEETGGTPSYADPLTIVAPTVEPTHNAPVALGGQIKTTNPAGLRLGFSIADLGEEYTDLTILVKKADGDWKTVDVTKFYDTESTIFTVCITNIPDSAKDVEFTAKAVVTFADGTSTESTAITKSFNGITTAIDANWN